MRIRLIDVDSKIPNLALMKVSRYHKDKGDTVGFGVGDPDKVYVSIIFKENKHRVDGLRFFHPDAEIEVGGSGHDLDKGLQAEIEELKPDYDLYDTDYSLGFTTRGCDRSCEFCIVPEKEGNFRRHRHPKQFHKQGHDKIVFLDNNILLDKEWFFEVTDWVLGNGLKADFNQGLDVRLLDEEVAHRLAEMERWRTLKFAFDFIEMEDTVRRGIDLLAETDIDLRRHVQFYVYLGKNGFDTAHQRCKMLKKRGVNAFVMLDQDIEHPQKTKDLARWANRRWLYWSIDFEDYQGSRRNKADQQTSLPINEGRRLKSFEAARRV